MFYSTRIKASCFRLLMYACLMIAGIHETYGQQCTGYVLYKEDFGDDNTPGRGGPLPAGVTSYEYTTAVPVEDGFYGIRKQVTSHQDSWFQATDHTGNGYMMLINASYDPGLFYETKINNLCQGSSFYFSAWVANLMMASASGPLNPNLKFVIRKASDSSVIISFETGLLKRYSTLTWEQYGINFSLPSGETSVILQIFNNSGGGNGNDLVLDDITFSICGPDIQMQQAGVYGNTHDACLGDEITFDAKIGQNFYHDPEYLWQFGTDTLHWENITGANSPAYHLSAVDSRETGWYRILVSEKGNIHAEHCRIASDPIPLNVHAPVAFTIRTNSPVCEGTTLELDPSADAISYRWQGPGGFESDRPKLAFENASVAQQGHYSLTAVTDGGCVSTGSAETVVEHNSLTVSLKDSVLCEGSSITLDASNAGALYTWNTGAKTAAITIDTGGFYKVQVVKGACSLVDSITVRRILQPRVDLGNDTAICIGEPYTLDAASPDVTRYLWQDGTVSPAYEVTKAGNYAVTLTNVCGSAGDNIHITTEECADRLLFPTAFSPNGDGINDYFRPKLFLNIADYELRIYDRWGQMVFYSKDPGEGWDGDFRGSRASGGTYIWMARYTRQRDNHPMAQQGTITLIR